MEQELHTTLAAGLPAGCTAPAVDLHESPSSAVHIVMHTAGQMCGASAHLRQVEARDQAGAVRQAQLDGGDGRRLVGARPPCSGAGALLRRCCACRRTTGRRRRRRLRCGGLGCRACRSNAPRWCTARHGQHNLDSRAIAATLLLGAAFQQVSQAMSARNMINSSATKVCQEPCMSVDRQMQHAAPCLTSRLQRAATPDRVRPCPEKAVYAGLGGATYSPPLRTRFTFTGTAPSAGSRKLHSGPLLCRPTVYGGPS